MRTLIAATTAFTWLPMIAEASEKRFFADTAVSSSLIDRGEQIGPLTLETAIGAETEVGGATLYGAFYRLTPVGADADAFVDEADYTVGAAWEGQGYTADVSATWLTFPGEGEQASLELAGSVGIDAPLMPSLTGFYDAEFEDWGLELAAGPVWEIEAWEVYALARAGFVRPGDGSASRSYGGVEAGAARPVSEGVVIGFYARAELADEESFARSIDGGIVTASRSSGYAAGISLSLSR
jgi:hypothetical protein